MLADINPEGEDNKENVIIKKEEDVIIETPEIPSKCIELSRTVQVNCQVQYIDFEGRSDGESLLTILPQLRPQRIRGCLPVKGETVDCTSETHIYQVRLTDALVSQLNFQKASKETEVAWIDAQIVVREGQSDARRMNVDNEPMEIDEESKVLTLEPTSSSDYHDTVFINELKLSEFKQVLARCNITSEFSGGVLWCCNGTIAVRRVESGRVILEGCISEDYYKVRSILYEQFAIL
ncbi:hypothetical protein WA026_018609 [Henosepilachna vigintioctopunctata]|uniref:Cleavage and polyadenylation specificity factor subunit 2 n=1 Tax=Henosepilachna vigintioctopunctata TaxID=420089 RepID=A0AAW1U8S8_9CUCU